LTTSAVRPVRSRCCRRSSLPPQASKIGHPRLGAALAARSGRSVTLCGTHCRARWSRQMLVLHGFWSLDDGLCLWARDSDRTVKSPSQALRSVRPHPFAASTGVLAGIWAGKPGEATLLLPSLRMAPLDSPELVRVAPRPTASSAPALLAWNVPVVTLDAAAALTALSARAEGVRHGVSLDYLAELAAFGWELAVRGRVLPTFERSGAGAVARWRPVVQGRDVVAVHELVTAMPPVCRAVPGRDDPHELVTAALRVLVDAAVREMLPD